MTGSRRTGWVMVAGAVVAALVVARRHRRLRPAPAGAAATAARADAVRPVAPSLPPMPPPAGAGSSHSGALLRMAIGAGVFVVLAIVFLITIRPPDSGPSPDGPPVAGGPFPSDGALTHGDPELSVDSVRPGDPRLSGGQAGPMPPPMSLADCQAAIAAQLDLTGLMTCGYETAGLGTRYDEPSADPNDPRYAGAALPTALSTDGRICVAGGERPVLDTIRPTLSASFTAPPGLQRIDSTFQITGVYGRTPDDLQFAGDSGDPLKATLDFTRHGKLRHGESYRWRVRGTPPSVGAGGWSPWCEFTIPKTTPDDLGLDDHRDYRLTLPATEWREILKVTEFAPFETAMKAAPKTDQIPLTLTGDAWSGLVNALAYRASENNERGTWKLADLVSSALDGPDRPTMGVPRP